MVLEALVPPPQDAQENSGELGRQIKQFTFVLAKRKWWIVLSLLLAVTAAVVVTKRQQPVYRATASVIIESSPPRVLSGVKDVVDLGPSQNYWSTREYFQTQYKVITGLEVCERVVAKLHLDDDPAFLGVPPGQVLTDEEKARRAAGKVPARLLQARLSVEPVRDSMMVLVSAEDTDPERAADIANEVVFAYRAQNIEYRRSVTQEANAELRDMVDKYRVRKENADKELLDYERSHNIGSFASRKQAIEDRLKLLNDRQGQLLVRRSDLEARVARVKRIEAADDLYSVPLDSILGSSLVGSLKAKRVELKDQRAALLAQYGEKHPRLVALDGQLAQVEDTLRREVRAFLNSAKGDYDEVRSALNEVGSLITSATKDLSELATMQVEYNALSERKKDSTEVYDQVRTRFTEISLSAQVETNNVRVHELAQVPGLPARPDMRLALAVGLALGLLLGLGLAFLVEQLDNSVKDREEVERLMGVPCLGVIPTIPGSRRRRSRRKDATLQDRDFYVLQNPKSVVAEALNTIRTNLMFILPERRIRTVLVTSGSPWEGKSTVVIMMGVTQARYGQKTLIVDTDMRRPRMHRTFGIDGDHGLSTLLLGEGTVDQAIYPTEIPNLHVMPCGPVPPNPSELLRMERLGTVMADLQARYDTVILDSPPVIPVADPRLLAGLVDGVVLVVKLHHTTQEALKTVRRELAGVGAPLLGTILNDLDVRGPGGYGYGYGYYYGHRYGYGYGYPSIEDEGPRKPDAPKAEAV